MKNARFTAHFTQALGKHSKATRTFRGTIKVGDGGTDLVTAVVGALVAIANEEKIGDVKSIKVSASTTK